MSSPNLCTSFVLNFQTAPLQNVLYQRRVLAKNVQTAFAKDLDYIRSLLLTLTFRLLNDCYDFKTIFLCIQPEILGLRYISNTGKPRWVDLSRPLKRQLDKYSRHFSLLLRVMYFISNVSFIKDEMTRLVFKFFSNIFSIINCY